MDIGTALYNSTIYITKSLVFIYIFKEVSGALRDYWHQKTQAALGTLYYKTMAKAQKDE